VGFSETTARLAQNVLRGACMTSAPNFRVF
jgi:hypothetical protein